MALYNYIINTGTVVADTSEILSQIQNEYKSVFGEDLNVNPETPQGLLINAEALARSAVAENNVALANQINPNLAGGIFLDAIAQLSGLSRSPATFSTVLATVTGVPDTVITTSAIAALSSTGEQFSPLSDITINDLGVGSGIFRARIAGPTAVAPSTLTQIVEGVVGWETITNVAAGTTGTSIQDDQAFRRLRQETLALQGTSLPEAITSGLFGAGIGVTSLTFRENTENTNQTIDGVDMLPHSIYVCVTNNNYVGFPGSTVNYLQVIASLTGTPGTVIPISAQASDGTHIYSPIVPITIQSDGNAVGVFQAAIAGVGQNIAANTLTTIETPISGWSTVDNTYPSFAYDYNFLYNVASILLSKKSGGCAWSTGPAAAPYGAQNIEVVEPVSGQEYLVSFDTPTPVPILVQVSVLITTGFTGDPTTEVRNAILNYAKFGNAQDVGFVVGADVSAWELATAVNLAVTGLFVTEVLITTVSEDDFSVNTIPIQIFEQATIQNSAITVLVTYPPGLLVSR